ncbi:MAG: hypothetical protein Q8R57_06735 [Bacteroidota bacterium]|nr:hypothetical protein [Bacteroidota bacterium]
MQNLTGIFTKIKGLQVLIVGLLMMASCDKTPEQIIAETPQLPDSNLVGMYIANEGNFQWGNASLSFYNPISGLVQTDIYKAHNGKGIGDVLQSIYAYQNKLYLVVNNSQKISVLDTKTWKEINTITGFNSPRYFLPVSAQKAYISDLYENAVYVLNLNTQQISGKIKCSGWTEEMVLLSNKAFVCGVESPFVYVINTSTDQIEDSVHIGYGAQYMRQDLANNIWVLSNGKAPILPSLTKINTAGEIALQLWFKNGDMPRRLEINEAKNQLFWINKDVYTLFVNDTLLPSQALITAGNKNFYALGYEPYNKEILVSDAKDYVQKSEVFRYSLSGQFKGSFHTQINTGNFYARTK